MGVFLLASVASAQDPPIHASLRDRFEQAGRSYSDVWAHGGHAYLGRFGNNEIDIVDLSNPDALALTKNVVVPSPNNGSSAQDVKVGRAALDPSKVLAFVAFEYSGPDALGIYDVTNPASPTLLTRVQPHASLYTSSHNLSYREDGWLAVANSATSDVAIVDLRTYDPSNPPATITSSDYLLTNLGSGFVHDLTLTDEYLYLAEWDSLQVWDVSDLGSSGPAYRGGVRGYSCHAVWPTDDAEYIVTTDERSGGSLRLWKMTDDGGSVTIEQTDSYVAKKSGPGAAYSAHNPVLLGDRIYTSHYSSGVVVHQIDRTDDTMEFVGRYDTSSSSPTGFSGAWGVYPLLGHDNVVASDMSNGLFTIDFSALQFRSPSERPTTLIPFETTPVTVAIDALGAIGLDSNTVQLFASVDGGPYTSTPMTWTAGVWRGELPAVGCGSKVDYYFSADSTAGENFVRPAAAPVRVYTAYASLTLTTVFADDFSTDKGWTVTNHSSVSNGQWERGTPVETGFQPSYDDADDAGDACFMTENGFQGGGTSDTDVDGGPTRLFSPILDFSAGDGVISYSAWHACSEPDTADGLVVSISNTGGGNWQQVRDIVRKSGGWRRESFRVSDFVTPTSTVQVRFTIQDNPNDSLTEAGVDNFLAQTFCADPAALAGFTNGSGSNPTCFVTSPPVLGQPWVSTVAHNTMPGASLTWILLYRSGSSGSFTPGGELLLDLSSGRLFSSVRGISASPNVHSHNVPADVAYAGAVSWAQAAILDPLGNFELCNAYSLTVGF